jgi:hypothetical protein
MFPGIEDNWMVRILQVVGTAFFVLLWIGIIHILGGWVIGGTIAAAVLFLTYVGLRRF